MIRRFGSEEEKLVLMALRSQNLSPYFANPDGGPLVQQFEKEFARYIGVDYAVAVSNGTSALHTAYTALGLHTWQKILVPAHTFLATASMVLAVNNWLVWGDIDRRTYCLTQDSVQVMVEHYKNDVQAIVPVDLLGYPAPLEEMYDYAHHKKIFVVEDAAQALGATRKRGRKVGSQFNDCATWSFQQTKSLTSGEGGMITTNDRAFAKKCKAIRNHGSYYQNSEFLTYNFRMSELHAAVGLAQLRKYPKILEQQRRNAEYVIAHLPKSITPPWVGRYAHPNWYIIGCKVDARSFDKVKFIKALQERKVSVGLPGRVVSEGYTKPLYLKPLFRYVMPHRDWMRCLNAEWLSKCWIWLDLHRFRPLKEVVADMKIVNEVASQ